MKKSGILIVFMLLAASNAWAFRGGCGMEPGFGMSSSIASSLNLSEDQKAQIQARQEVFQDEINPLRDELFTKRMELRELWAEASPEQSRISAKQKEIQAVQSQIQEKTTQFQLECRELLTPEQQEQLGTTMAHHGGWGGPGRKMHSW